MDYYQRVAGAFAAHMEHISLSVDRIADTTGQAAELATHAMLAERKLLCVGCGADAATALAMADLLRSGLIRERPSLPVIEVVSRQAAMPAAIDWVAGQLRALCQPGDVALLFVSQLDAITLEPLAYALGQRESIGVWLGAAGPGGVSIDYPEATPASRLLLNYATALSVADLIDGLTFGALED